MDQTKKETKNSQGQELRFFRLTPSELILYIILGVFSMLLLNAKAIWNYFSKDVLSLNGGNASLTSDLPPRLGHIVSSISQSRLPLFLFWLVVGCLVYLLIWFLRNVYLNIRNDFVVDNYVHPAGYDRHLFWETALVRKCIFGLSVIILLIYVVFFCRVLPVMAQECYDSVVNYELTRTLEKLILTSLSASLLIYVLVLLIRTVGRCWRFIYNDF